eukprot:1692249-Pyramimonas_sp.AAC.1
MGARPSALDGVEGYPRHSSASSQSTFERGCESADNMTSDVKRLGDMCVNTTRNPYSLPARYCTLAIGDLC